MSRLIILSEDGQDRILELRAGTRVIGRREDCDIVLPDDSVSSRHCELKVTDFGITLEDLGSTNGTFVAGQQVRQATLQDGQVLRVGAVSIRVEIPPVRIAIPDLPPPEVPGPRFLEDGTPACQNHPDVAAAYRCVRCEDTFCAGCVHDVHLEGQAPRWFCPACSGRCEVFTWNRASGRRSLLDRLVNAVRPLIRRGGDPPGSDRPGQA